LGVGRPSRPGAPISAMIIVMAFGIFGQRKFAGRVQPGVHGRLVALVAVCGP
jgi:hypothetical protein